MNNAVYTPNKGWGSVSLSHFKIRKKNIKTLEINFHIA